jgi:transposase
MIKLGTVATDIFGVSGRAMLPALVAGQRDPKVLAKLARGRLHVKHAALVEALAGQFNDRHAVVARILLDQIDTLGGQIERLTAKIERLTAKIEEAIAAIPAAGPPAPDPPASGRPPLPATPATGGPTDTAGPKPPAPLAAVDRLDEVPGIGRAAAQVLIAELGLDMGQFPTPAHLVSWARLSPRTIQSGAKHRAGATGKDNPYSRARSGRWPRPPDLRRPTTPQTPWPGRLLPPGKAVIFQSVAALLVTATTPRTLVAGSSSGSFSHCRRRRRGGRRPPPPACGRSPACS